MSEDLTTKLLQSTFEKLTLVLTIVQSLTVRVDNIDSRINRVEQTMDESRPALQLLVTDVARLRDGQLQLEAGQRRLEEQCGRLEEKCGRLEEGLQSLSSQVHEFRRAVDYRFLILSGTVLDRYNKLEQRVTRLELNSNPPNTET